MGPGVVRACRERPGVAKGADDVHPVPGFTSFTTREMA